MTVLRRVSAGLIVLTLAGSHPSADWPQWRGPSRDGRSNETGLLQQWPLGGPALTWTATGLGSGFASVAVAGGRVFTMGDRGGQQYVLAFREADGKPAWSTAVTTPTYNDAGSPGPRGTPTVDGALLYAVASDGTLVCLETLTGKERWRRHLEKDFGGRTLSMRRYVESPLVDGTRVVVTPGGPAAALVALDKRTGKEIWRAAPPENIGPRGADGAAGSSMALSQGGGVKQYVQMIGRGLVGVRAADGRVLWHYNRIASETVSMATPTVRGDLVFASSADQSGSVLLKLTKAGDGISLTETYSLGQEFQNNQASLVLVGEFLYGADRLGSPFCLNWGTGKFLWNAGPRDQGQGSAAIAYADGRLYYRYENGRVALVEATPEAYQELGGFPIVKVQAPSWSQPVISGGQLYLREQDNLYRYNIRARAPRK